MSAVIDPVRATGRSPLRPAPDPDYIGCVIAEQRGVHGPISLEVLLSPGAAGIEIGPFRLNRRETVALSRLLALTVDMLAKQAPAMSRNPTGRAVCPPWEGEALP